MEQLKNNFITFIVWSHLQLKKMATKTVQTNIGNHFRIDKFYMGSISNIGNLE